MGRPRSITPVEYQRYVDAFLAVGNHPKKAAALLGVAYNTAKLGWEAGWLASGEWARPIKEVYAERTKQGVDAASVDREGQDRENSAPVEVPVKPAVQALQVHVMSSVEIRRMLDAAIAKVQADVAEALLREQQAIEVARNNVAGLLLSVDKLIAFTRPLIDAMMAKLQVMAADTSVQPKQVLDLLMRIAKVNKLAIEQADKVLSMQRLLAGQPQAITEHRSTPVPQQLAAEGDRERLASMLEQAQRRQALTAITEPTVGEASVDDAPVVDG